MLNPTVSFFEKPEEFLVEHITRLANGNLVEPLPDRLNEWIKRATERKIFHPRGLDHSKFPTKFQSKALPDLCKQYNQTVVKAGSYD